MIKLYGFWRSAAAFRVRMALNLKGLAYEETMIDLDAGEQHGASYLSINPHANVPTIFMDGVPPMTQSLAILEYLEEAHPTPPLLPADAPARAYVRALALIYAADHHPLIVPRIRRYLTGTLGVSDEQRTDWIRHWFREGLVQGEAKLREAAQAGRFSLGDAPTIADLCLMSQAMGARGFGITTDDLPITHRIVEACLAIDAIGRALPLKQPGAPASH